MVLKFVVVVVMVVGGRCDALTLMICAFRVEEPPFDTHDSMERCISSYVERAPKFGNSRICVHCMFALRNRSSEQCRRNSMVADLQCGSGSTGTAWS